MDVFADFTPDHNQPLLISFSNHLAECGYSTKIEFDFWDMYAYLDDEPEIAVLTVKQNLTKLQIHKISLTDTPKKVVLAENLFVQWPRFDPIRTFLAAHGVGLYVRNVGWVVLPGNPRIKVPEDFQYRIVPRYFQDEDGNWLKKCSTCKRNFPPEQFPWRPQKTARDPRRNICKECHKKTKW